MKHFLFLCVFFALSSTCCQSKIIYIVAYPRTLSTILLRVMDAREDVTAFNDPNFPIVAVQRFKEDPHCFRSDISLTYNILSKQIKEAAKNKIVVVKDMAVSILDHARSDPDFFKDQDKHFIILIRDVGDSLASQRMRFSKPAFDKFTTDAQNFFDLMNINGLGEVFECAKKNSPNPVFILKAEDLYTHPTQTMKALCKAVNISFDKSMMTWAAYGKDFEKNCTWHENRTEDVALYWSKPVIESTSIHKPTTYEKTDDGRPTFSEEKNTKKRAVLFEVYNKMLPFYKAFLEAEAYHIKPLINQQP